MTQQRKLIAHRLFGRILNINGKKAIIKVRLSELIFK